MRSPCAACLLLMLCGCDAAGQGTTSLSDAGLDVPSDSLTPDDAGGRAEVGSGESDSAVVRDSASGEVATPARVCADPGQEMRCLVRGLSGLTDAMQCICDCSPPDEQYSRPSCDPTVFDCCRWEEIRGDCTCSNQVWRDSFGMAGCVAYAEAPANGAVVVSTCP